MYSILLGFVSAFLLVAVPCASTAAPLKTYVSDFSVIGAPNKDELKTTLQSMLTSRLNPNQALLVDSQDKAELLISGSYALFGKMFSLDVLLKRTGSDTITKVFEQGDGQDDLIPAINRMAQKIERELARFLIASEPALVSTSPPLSSQTAATQVEAPPAVQAKSYVVHSDNTARNIPGTWTSEPLEGVFSGIALGRTLPSGEREIFVAGDHSIRSYRKGTELKLVAETAVPVPARILAIDTADLDGDGIPELYVTIMDRESLSSRVYLADDAKLEKIAENLPWFFRGIGQDLKSRTIYVQEMGTSGEFYGGVAELTKAGNRFEARNPVKLPRFGTIYNFSRISDSAGKTFFVILDEDGYLVVSTLDGEEIWKSSDKFGGSEMSFKRKDYAKKVAKGDPYRWTSLEQRMLSLPGGTILVPRNEGTFVVGNSRSYDKHTIFALQWNGSMFKELWHTRQTPSYLADFIYDPSLHELVLLEVVKKDSLFGKGRSVISVNRIE